MQKVCLEEGHTRFGVLRSTVMDNGTQFAGKRFQEILFGLNIKQHFISVEHTQATRQAKAVNKVIL